MGLFHSNVLVRLLVPGFPFSGFIIGIEFQVISMGWTADSPLGRGRTVAHVTPAGELRESTGQICEEAVVMSILPVAVRRAHGSLASSGGVKAENENRILDACAS